MNAWLAWGIPMIRWLQSIGSWLTPPMHLFTNLGNEEFFLLLMPMFYWCYDAALGLRVGLILLTSSGLNSVFKEAIGWPRPFWVSRDVQALAEGSTFGMPSGHAQTALATWGRLAAGIGRRGVTLLLATLVFLISLSRSYLGVHFPADVLAGWVIGGVTLWAFLRFDKPLTGWMRAKSLSQQLAFALLASLLLLALGTGVHLLTVGRGVPEDWVSRAASASPVTSEIQPRSAGDLVASSGTLLGLAAGGVMLFRWGKFNAGGAWWKRGLRYVLGALGVALLFFGLKWALPSGESLLDHALRYLRYAAVGFWAAYGAPRVFVRLGLA